MLQRQPLQLALNYSRILSSSSRRCFAAASGPQASTKASPTPEHVDVVVCGSGLVGSAVACALGGSSYMANHRIVMLDGMPNPPELPTKQTPISNRVVALRAASVNFLKSLKAWEIIEGVRARPYQHMQVWDACADSGIDFDAKAVGRDNLGYLVENKLIQASLQRVINEQGKVEASWGVRIASVEKAKGPGDLITVTLQNGRVLKTRLLIGADGANSFVRKSMGIDTIGWDYQQSGVVGTLELEPSSLSPNGNTTAWQRFIPTGPVAILPMTDTVSSLVWSTSPALAKMLVELPAEEFVSALNTALTAEPSKSFPFAEGPTTGTYHRNGLKPPRMPPTIKSVMEKSRASFPLGLSHSKQYVSERLALIGDAAHRMHPLAGQGVNSGFGDAEDLSKRVIHDAFCGLELGSKTTLLAYETARQRANTPMMIATDTIKRLYTTDFPPIVLLRSLGMNATNSLGPLK
eukprot:Ihof_evm2s504 gene=Ihof_evmTU2s504